MAGERVSVWRDGYCLRGGLPVLWVVHERAGVVVRTLNADGPTTEPAEALALARAEAGRLGVAVDYRFREV